MFKYYPLKECPNEKLKTSVFLIRTPMFFYIVNYLEDNFLENVEVQNQNSNE